MEQLLKPAPLVAQVVVLAMTGVSMLIWTGLQDWQDQAGTSVGGVMIALGVAQAGLSFLWWRKAKTGHVEQFEEQQHQPQELTTLPTSEV